MLEFTASDETLKRTSDSKWLLALVFGSMGLAFVVGLVANGLALDWLVVSFFLFLVVVMGATYWFVQRNNSKFTKSAATQRVTLSDKGIENYNDLWQEVYPYEDIEKLTVVRSKSGEVKGVAIQLPKKVVDFSTLGQQEELYQALVQKLPQIPVQSKSLRWQRTKTIGFGVPLLLGFLILPRYLFPENEWLNEFILFLWVFFMGVHPFVGREIVSGVHRQRRNAWLFLGIAAMYAVGLTFRFI